MIYIDITPITDFIIPFTSYSLIAYLLKIIYDLDFLFSFTMITSVMIVINKIKYKFFYFILECFITILIISFAMAILNI